MAEKSTVTGAEPERPAFATRYPRHPELDQLVEAFASGNYGHVRSRAPALAERTDDDDVRTAARDLARRIEPPTTAKFLWGLAMALLAFLFAFYLSHAP